VSIAKEFLDKWPSALVTRTEVAAFSGGLINPGTLADLAAWIEQWGGMREVQSGGVGIRGPPAQQEGILNR